MRKILRAKIHRASVTEADLDYVGSITIDADLLKAANILPNESVLVANIDNGNRFETYVLEGPPGSGVIGVNGAAARLVNIADRVLILAFDYLTEQELADHESRVVIVDEHNCIVEQLRRPTRLSEPMLV